MSAIGPTLRQRQQERTRGDIIHAALRLVSEDGAERITVDRVIALAGMSRGTLYSHFPGGLDEIVRASYDALGAQLLETGRVRAEHRDEWADRLAAYAEAMLELAEDAELGFFYNISGPSRVGLNGEPGIGSEGSREAFRDELTRAQQKGAIPADIDVVATAALLVGTLRQAGIDVARDRATAPAYLAAFRRLLRALSVA